MLFKIILSLFAAQAFASGGSIIGNGGDGYFIPDIRAVWLRDLVDAGLEHSAWIGAKRDPEIEKFIYGPNFRTDVDIDFRRDLLVRKLTDIQLAAPPLGRILAQAIRLYQWQMVHHPLEFVNDGVMLKMPPNSVRVQIGNRLLKTIRYDDDQFAMMPDEHRIAFIIHEVVYSLLKPQCLGQSGLCRQFSILAREIVGHMFSDNADGKMTPILQADLQALSVPEDMNSRGGQFDWWMWEEVGPSKQVRLLHPLTMTSLEEIQLYVSSQCRLVWEMNRSAEFGPVELVSEISAPTFVVKFEPYNAAGSGIQYGLKVDSTSKVGNLIRVQFTNSSTSIDKCYSALAPHIARAGEFAF